LSEVVAVAQRLSANPHDAGVDGLNAVDLAAIEVELGGRIFRAFGSDVVIEFGEQVDGLVIAAGNDGGGRILEHVEQAAAGPWPHVDECGIEVAHAVESQGHRVDDAVDRDVGRAQRVVAISETIWSIWRQSWPIALGDLHGCRHGGLSADRRGLRIR
jgi:hypothetical protein